MLLRAFVSRVDGPCDCVRSPQSDTPQLPHSCVHSSSAIAPSFSSMARLLFRFPQGGRPRLCLGGIIAQPEGRGAGCRGEVRRAFCMKRDCRSCLREESPWRRDAESVARCYRPPWHANGMRVVRARRWGCLCLVDVGYAIRCAEDAVLPHIVRAHVPLVGC